MFPQRECSSVSDREKQCQFTGSEQLGREWVVAAGSESDEATTRRWLGTTFCSLTFATANQRELSRRPPGVLKKVPFVHRGLTVTGARRRWRTPTLRSGRP